MGIKGGKEGREIKSQRRQRIASGTAKGRENVIPIPRTTIQGVNGSRYIPMCMFTYHLGIIRNDEGCVKTRCGYYRQFVINPQGTTRSHGQSTGSINYEDCPIGSPDILRGLESSEQGASRGLEGGVSEV